MERRTNTVKWLRVLTWIAAASLVNSVIDWIPGVHGDITTWISRGIMAAAAFCMFQLAPDGVSYQRAGVSRLVMLACSLVTSFLFGSYALTGLAFVASLIAVYQEYYAHSQLILEMDGVLSRNWYRLFWWQIAASILLTVGTSVAAVLIMASDRQVDASRLSGTVVFILEIPRFVLSVIYLSYLKKTVGCLSDTGK